MAVLTPPPRLPQRVTVPQRQVLEKDTPLYVCGFSAHFPGLRLCKRFQGEEQGFSPTLYPNRPVDLLMGSRQRLSAGGGSGPGIQV